MNTLATDRGAHFVVLVEDFERIPQDCGRKIPYADRLIGDLKKYSIPFLKASDYYLQESCLQGDLRVQYDGHPSALANKVFARGLAQYLKELK